METKKITIDKRLKYEGYLWYSDAQEPTIFNGNELTEDICSDQNPVIPFIIEGYLRTGNDSYSIRMIDGEYRINHFVVPDSKEPYTEYSLVSYLPNRFECSDVKIDKLNFALHWGRQADELCEGMEVLVPKELIFIGFEKRLTNDK